MRTTWLKAVGAVLAVGLLGPTSYAADHADGTPAGLGGDPTADITDLFAFMSSDANTLNLIMDVAPGAGPTTKFSDKVKYVFHINSRGSFFPPGAGKLTNVICTFDTAATQNVSCWVADTLGNPLDKASGAVTTGATGVASTSGKVKVWAGAFDDPFFFNLAGFQNTAKTGIQAIKGSPMMFKPDANGCIAAASAVGGLVAKDCTGMGAPVDFFKKSLGAADPANATCTDPYIKNVALSGNILALVVTVDKSLVNGGGPIIGVWGSTNK